MTSEIDPYVVLGVARTASDEDIRRAYRKLAREHHPDVNPGKPEAEERFKRLAVAYEVLSNRERRALYDEFGEQALRSGFDPEQARAYRRYVEGTQVSGRTGGRATSVPFDFDLSDLLHRATARDAHAAAQPFPIDGEDLLATVELDLAASLRGTELELRVPSRAPCDGCSGSGWQSVDASSKCADCGGTGRQHAVRGPLQMMATCASCGGSGQSRRTCGVCQGAGYLQTEQTVRVRIPPGVDDGEELRVRGRGSPGLFGGEAGDAIIRTRVKEHPYFEREGLDLTLRLPITIGEALLGASVEVPTPGGPVTMKVPPRSQQGKRLRLRGKGVARGVDRGDLYVVLDIQMPDSRELGGTEQLDDLERFYAKPVREGVGL